MAASTARKSAAQPAPSAEGKTQAPAEVAVTKATQPTDAERKQGIVARRKVRATSHVIERIDGKVHELGEDGGRWIVRVVDTGDVHRFKTYGEMTKAGRTL